MSILKFINNLFGYHPESERKDLISCYECDKVIFRQDAQKITYDPAFPYTNKEHKYYCNDHHKPYTRVQEQRTYPVSELDKPVMEAHYVLGYRYFVDNATVEVSEDGKFIDMQGLN